MLDFKKLFKREDPMEKKTGLEKALALGWITEEEFLVLKEKRAADEVKAFYERTKKGIEKRSAK